LRPIRSAFVHHARSAVCKGAVDDVAVARDPSDIRGAPICILILQIEDPFRSYVSADQIAARGVNHSLRLSRRARSVEYKERMLRVELLGLALLRNVLSDLVPPVIAPLLHMNGFISGAAMDDDVFDRRTLFESFIDARF